MTAMRQREPEPPPASPLKARLREIIHCDGPIPLSRYMDICLNDPDHGYYATRRPIGAHGDFTTAPEISQMFGELVAVWAMAAWNAMGRPDPFALVEIGPGRGTLAADLVRTARSQLAFARASRLHLVETSPTLRDAQREAVGEATWHERVTHVPPMPLVVVANEVLDALPFEQYRHAGGWRRQVVNERNGRLVREDGEMAALARAGRSGELVEASPAREAMVREVAALVAARGGAALWFDYGSLSGGTGDTLQAIAGHARADPFEHPGEADLTSHVDFAPLVRAAEQTGCVVQATVQGQFLLQMGLLERAGALGANADETQRDAIRAAVERLAGPSAMGELFKVVALRHGDLPPLPGFGERP